MVIWGGIRYNEREHRRREFSYMLVHDLLRRGNNSDDAVYSQLGALTYLGLRVAAENTRRRLYAEGIRRGTRVAVFSRNRAEYIAAAMAIASLGAILIPVNFQFTERETVAILKDADCRYCLADRVLDLGDALHREAFGPVKQLSLTDLIEPTTLPPPPLLPPDFGSDDPYAILYGMSSEGTLRGTVLSHRNLVMNAIDVQQTVLLRRTDNVLCALPMYQSVGWICGVLCALYVGATVSILETFTPQKIVDVTRALHVTVIVTSPSALPYVTKLADPADLKSLRFAVAVGRALPSGAAEAFWQKFGVGVASGYGIPEASAVVTLSPPEAPRVGSVGQAIPDVRLRVAGGDGLAVPAGEIGELWVQGPNVMHGYWRQDEATAAALRDGWLHTGDMAHIDERGDVYLAGRRGRYMESSGEEIAPREIERVVLSYPGIAEAAVAVVPDPQRGEAAVLFYTAEKDGVVETKALKKYLQKRLALFKMPRDMREIETMPRQEDGQIDTARLRSIPLPVGINRPNNAAAPVTLPVTGAAKGQSVQS